MDVQVMRGYARIAATTAKTLLDLVPPYEGQKGGMPPPALESEGPGVTINRFGKGAAVYCAGKPFDAYFTESTPVLRKLTLWMLGLVHPAETRIITLDSTPINVEMFYNARDDERFVHLINYAGDKRETGTPQTQDMVTVHGIIVDIALPARPREVTLVPEGSAVPFEYRGGRCRFVARPLGIHDVYRILV